MYDLFDLLCGVALGLFIGFSSGTLFMNWYWSKNLPTRRQDDSIDYGRMGNLDDDI